MQHCLADRVSIGIHSVPQAVRRGMRFYGDPIKSSSTGRDLDETKFANATLASSSRLLQFVFTILVPITFVTLSGCDRQSRSENLETAKKTQSAPPAAVSIVYHLAENPAG